MASKILASVKPISQHYSACRAIHLSATRRNSDDQLRVFRDNATKWWSGKEFDLLRAMNEIRVPFIVNGLNRPIEGSKIIDVGCGGGILSEPLARLGANVIGIDPVFESINQAQLHSERDPTLKDRLKYRNCNIEDLSNQSEHIEQYDALVASEVLEHIDDVEGFLKHCTRVIKPNGSIFITTINQTPLSWLGVIFFGEYILKQLPKGTHNYDMFVNVKGLKVMLERLGYDVRLINGFMYEPVVGNFYWTPKALTHYALQAIKTIPSNKGLNFEQKRHAPKPGSKRLTRPKIVLDAYEMEAVIPYSTFKTKTEAIIQEFKEHIENKLTLRASTASLETVKVELPGLSEPLEIRDIAQIAMKGTSLIVLNLSAMPEAVKPTVEALEKLGNISPQVEVNNIFVPIPRVTREHRETLVAAGKQAAHRTKDQLKGLFSEFSNKASTQKGKGISQDLIRQTIENLDFQTKKSLLEIDELFQSRTKQLLNE